MALARKHTNVVGEQGQNRRVWIVVSRSVEGTCRQWTIWSRVALRDVAHVRIHCFLILSLAPCIRGHRRCPLGIRTIV